MTILSVLEEAMPHVAGRAFVERWMRAYDGDGSPTRVEGALARAARYPAPVDKAWSRMVEAMDVAAPMLLLGRPKRASALSDDDFDALEHQLAHHRAPAVRA